MNIFTAIFGTKEQKAEAKADTAERKAEKAAAKAAKLDAKRDARQARIDARAASREDKRDARQLRIETRAASRAATAASNSAQRSALLDSVGPVAVIDALGQALSPDKEAIKIRQDAKTQRNADRAAAGDTTTPAQDILSRALDSFDSARSDAHEGFTDLAGAYVGGLGGGLANAAGDALENVTQGVTAKVTAGVTPIVVGLGVLGLGFLAMSGGKKKAS